MSFPEQFVRITGHGRRCYALDTAYRLWTRAEEQGEEWEQLPYLARVQDMYVHIDPESERQGALRVVDNGGKIWQLRQPLQPEPVWVWDEIT